MKYGKMEWGQMEAVVNKLGGMNGVERFLRDEFVLTERQPAEPKPVPAILEFIGTTGILATASQFVAREKFLVNTDRNAPVKISYVSDNFTSWFLEGGGKTEEPLSEQTLRYARLKRSSVDAPIIAELGGEAKAETTLSEMFSLMGNQSKGESGVLLNNGYANIFYIRDRNNVLRPVLVGWDDEGWSVDASAVDDPYAWPAVIQVFSCNPLKTQAV